MELVGPLVPAVRPGDAYSGSGTATVGLPVSVRYPSGSGSHAPGFLTVAHGVGAVGSAVTITASTGSVPAHVEFRDESARGPGGGDDIALVVLDSPYQLGAGWVVNQGTQPAPNGPPYTSLPVDLFGRRSGKVIAQVNGALLQMGDRTWQWLDCWELGVTQPLMERGNSGALAIDPSLSIGAVGLGADEAVHVRQRVRRSATHGAAHYKHAGCGRGQAHVGR